MPSVRRRPRWPASWAIVAVMGGVVMGCVGDDESSVGEGTSTDEAPTSLSTTTAPGGDAGDDPEDGADQGLAPRCVEPDGESQRLVVWHAFARQQTFVVLDELIGQFEAVSDGIEVELIDVAG